MNEDLLQQLEAISEAVSKGEMDPEIAEQLVNELTGDAPMSGNERLLGAGIGGALGGASGGLPGAALGGGLGALLGPEATAGAGIGGLGGALLGTAGAALTKAGPIGKVASAIGGGTVGNIAGGLAGMKMGDDRRAQAYKEAVGYADGGWLGGLFKGVPRDRASQIDGAVDRAAAPAPTPMQPVPAQEERITPTLADIMSDMRAKNPPIVGYADGGQVEEPRSMLNRGLGAGIGAGVGGAMTPGGLPAKALGAIGGALGGGLMGAEGAAGAGIGAMLGRMGGGQLASRGLSGANPLAAYAPAAGMGMGAAGGAVAGQELGPEVMLPLGAATALGRYGKHLYDEGAKSGTSLPKLLTSDVDKVANTAEKTKSAWDDTFAKGWQAFEETGFKRGAKLTSKQNDAWASAIRGKKYDSDVTNLASHIYKDNPDTDPATILELVKKAMDAQ